MTTASLLQGGPGGDRQVWRLAWPIMLSNLSVPLVGAVDTAVVGHLPDPVYIGAVAAGTVVFTFLQWGFAFLRMGTTGLVAQAFGANDITEVRTVLVRALVLGVVLGVILVALQWPIRLVGFYFLDTSAELKSLAGDYFTIRVWSAPAVLVNHGVLGVLIGLHNTRGALVVQLLLNLSNVLLNLALVFGFGFGVAGVALASVLAEYLAMGVGLWLVFRQLRQLDPRAGLNRIADAVKLRALMALNLNIFVRTVCLIAANYSFLMVGARLGEITLAANAVLIHLQHFLAFGLDGFAFAAEALAGSAYGARDRRRFRAAVVAASRLAFASAAVFTVVYALGGSTLVYLLTGITEVQETAHRYLPWLVVSPLISVWSFMLDGIFIGTTRAVAMRNAMLIAVGVYLLALAVLVPLLGNHGLWLAYLVLLSARALTLGWWYPALERELA